MWCTRNDVADEQEQEGAEEDNFGQAGEEEAIVEEEVHTPVDDEVHTPVDEELYCKQGAAPKHNYGNLQTKESLEKHKGELTVE